MRRFSIPRFRPPGDCLIPRLLVGVLLVCGFFIGFAGNDVGRAEEPSQPAAFPLVGLMPKQETNAAAFLEKHPEYDGRGVVVAVFDTGVDPGAEGLRTTTDGQPKVIDVVDASGSGDVDTSTVREAADGELAGLSGRTLTLPDDWNNPSGKYHLGLKPAYELFPRRVIPRLRAKRKEDWMPRQRQAVTRLEREIAQWDADHPDPNDEQRRWREELATRLEVLRQLQEEYEDPGPVFDCVVFHDGEVWRAAIDTDEDGKLADEKLLTDYHREHEYGTFGAEDLVNFAVNIYDEGNTLSIVVDSGEHGTHVAGIIAGHYPKQPELNGIAPGAQIVSVKIGDTRVGTRSLGTGTVRGVIAALRSKCDLINMSYGGATPEPNRGRITDIYREIVDRHGVIFVASAGNSGPALSTAGSPGGTTSAILGVGAVVSPNLMKAAYSLRDARDEEPFTWSSRGPTADGDLGVDIIAPGGAFAPVPRWALQRNRLMNGTSMSSPNACGGIALLLSALKSQKLYYTPYSVREAILNTARPLPGIDPFSQGQGMLQIDAALHYLEAHRTSRRQPLRYDVRLPELHDARGVYLREPAETERPLTTRVTVTPVFPHDDKKALRVDFNQRTRLECEADWVETPDFLLVPHGGRYFSIRVDPTELPAGLHVTQVVAYDADDPDRGPLWRLPVTIIRAEAAGEADSSEGTDEGDREDARSENDAAQGEAVTDGAKRTDARQPGDWQARMTFEPGQIRRRFIAVPTAATWADLAIRAGRNDGSRRLVAHALQLVPQREFPETSTRQYLTLLPGEQAVHSFPVVGGRTLELCLAQYWSSLGEAEFEVELTFHGLVPSSPLLEIDGSQVAARVEVAAPLRDEPLAPAAKLQTLRRSLTPSESELRPLSAERDTLPERRQVRELILQYEFELKKDATVIPRPAVDLLSQSGMELESGLWMIFDPNKQLLASGSGDDKAELPKGKYVLRLQLRHPEAKTLERFKQLPLLLDRQLKPPLALDIYDSGIEAFRRGAKAGERTLRRGGLAALYVATADADKLPDDARSGDVLLGELHFGKADGQLSGSGRRPEGFAIVYRVGPRAEDDADDDKPDAKDASSKMQAAGDKGKVGDKGEKKEDAKKKKDGEKQDGKKKGDSKKESDAKPEAWRKQLEERLAEAKLAELAALRKRQEREAFDELAKRLLEEREDDLPVLIEQLRFLDDKDRKPHLPEIVELTDEIISRIDQDTLARELAWRVSDEQDEAAKERRRELERQKEILIDALYRKGRALAYMDLPPKYGVPRPETDPVRRFPESKKERTRLFEQNFRELARWVDTTQDDYILLHIRRERRHNRRGTALELLNKQIEKEPHRELLYSKRIDLLHELKWQHWRDYDVQWRRRRFRESYPPF